MADRKTINKYYPPDFDPSKLTRSSKSKSAPKSGSAALQTVRLMAPFSMRCQTCGDFIYKGKKFNARKQPTGESYLGIKIIRFYIRCPRCAGEIRFKTDPQNSDYVTEAGAARNLEPWRDQQKEEETMEDRLVRLEREEAEAAAAAEEAAKHGGAPGAGGAGVSARDGGTAADPFAGLEAKVDQARHEMEVQDELEDLQLRNARLDELAAAQHLPPSSSGTNGNGTGVSAQSRKEDEEDAELARQIFGSVKRATTAASGPAKASGEGKVLAAATAIPTTARVSKKRSKAGIVVRRKV